MPKNKPVTFEEILKRPGAKEAWATLNDVREIDHAAVKRHLEGVANQSRFFSWHPPSPRDARRFAKRLKKAAPRINSMNIYFGETLPLGSIDYRNLPKIVEEYADALEKAATSRRKQRPSSCEGRDRELEIVRLLDQSDPTRERHFYEEAVILIQAAHNSRHDPSKSKEKEEVVDLDSLRHAYDRRSYRYRATRPGKYPC